MDLVQWNPLSGQPVSIYTQLNQAVLVTMGTILVYVGVHILNETAKEIRKSQYIPCWPTHLDKYIA